MESQKSSSSRNCWRAGCSRRSSASTYRDVCVLVADTPDLCTAIELMAVPHWTTLHKASRRLLTNASVRRLIDDTVRRIRGRKRAIRHAAVDSSDFETRHASGYYGRRRDGNATDPTRPKKPVIYSTFGQLMLIVCCTTHAVLAVVASAGPTPDAREIGVPPEHCLAFEDADLVIQSAKAAPCA